MTGDGLPDGAASAFVIGIISAMISGFFAVWLLLRYIRGKSFSPFVAYRVLAGVFVIAIAASSLLALRTGARERSVPEHESAPYGSP